jgi:ubiquinone/menaquinone biosynthesis C-methylase UbiE
MTEYLARRIDPDDPIVVSTFDEVSLWSARFGLLLVEELRLRRGIRVLDLGCGTGFPLFELANRHGPAATFVGVDVWAAALRRAALKGRRYELPDVALVRGDGAGLPLRTSSCDLIVSNLGVNNFADPRAVWRECARVARTAARLALTTNVKGHMREFYAVFRAVLAERGMAAAVERLARHEAHRGTRDALCADLEAAGFGVTRVVEEEWSLRFLDGAAFFRHALIRAGFLDAWRDVVAERDAVAEAAVFRDLETQLDRLAAADGELRLAVPMLYVEAMRR